tara:strand:- start:10069 stop:10497 length:429 start_codon:yes stop_codon:yes gene_type:complete
MSRSVAMLVRVQKIQLVIREEATQQALEQERTELVKLIKLAVETETETETETDTEQLWSRCCKWLSDVAFVNDVPEPLCDPVPLGLRPGETIGPKRKRRRTVEYIPTEHVQVESAEESTEESESESEVGSDSDSEYCPSDDE